MARGAAKQKAKQEPPRTTARRPGPQAHSGAKVKHNMSVEDTMFFPRLRNHAKPVFVFLAVIFGAGFVFLGVGSGSGGIGDLLDPSQWFGGSSSGTSLSSLQKKAEEHPNEARAQIDYATALDTKGKNAAALKVLEAYAAKHPKDIDVLTQLAGRYETKAQNETTKAQLAQIDAASISGSSLFPQLALGKDGADNIGPNPLVDAVTSKAQDTSTKAQVAANAAYTNDLRVLKLLVKAQPDDTISIIRLANAADQTGDTKTAIANYKRFLKLAPDDPQAALVKQRIHQIEHPTLPAVTATTGG